MSDAGAHRSIAIEGAEQVFTLPESGLSYLRLDRADEVGLDQGSISLSGGRIVSLEAGGDEAVRINASGSSVIPGFVDCHTHLPFVGWREVEYGQKVAGTSYEEISRTGGGIRSSSTALANATDEQVLTQAEMLAGEMLSLGTTAFECKSGYGLSIDAELRSLGLAAELSSRVGQLTRSTALVAHAVPEGETPDSWLEKVESRITEFRDAGASALDVYVESVAFDNTHLERIGELASANGMDLRAHVEQFACHRSVPVALDAGARSVDHLACIDPADIELLSRAECAAVLLPGAEFLGDEQVAPARELADSGAIGVLATDANPGTSPVVSLPLVIGLAVRRYRWTVLEALLATTINPAWVLRLEGETGSIESGRRADLVLLDGPVEAIPYRFGHNPVWAVILGGELAWIRPDRSDRIST